ncbi:hypothetical protein LJC17_01605 [Acholeplasma sp. OttesenSCG-928-E16]|nr:hypothetical protein [Acholeplasma sp. OttesenSCG-928-E16]
MKLRYSFRVILLKVSIAALMSMFVLYASGFTFKTDLDGQFNYIEILNSGEIENQITELNVPLINPGDYQEYSFIIKNSSDKPLVYYFSIDILDVLKDSNKVAHFEDCILIYVNGQFIGTLSNFMDKDYEGNFVETKIDMEFLIDNSTLENEKLETYDIRFELHNAILDNEYQASEIKLNMICYQQNINAQKYSIVEDLTDFHEAIEEINYYQVDKTILLSDSILLDKDVTISCGCELELMGNTLDLNGFTVNVEGDLRINSSNKEVIYTGLGAISLSDESAFLTLGDNVLSYGDYVDVTVFNEDVLIDRISKRVDNFPKIKSGSTEKIDLLGEYYLYKDFVDISVDGITTTNYLLENIASVDKTYILEIIISNETDEYLHPLKVIGRDDYTIISDILDNELKHIVFYSTLTEGIKPEVTFDLFLPTVIKGKNTIISWWSSDGSQMDNNGVLSDAAQGEITLVAEISVNGAVYVESFLIKVLKQNEDMKFQYLLARIGTIHLNDIFDGTPNTDISKSHEYLPIVHYGHQYDYRSSLYTAGKDLMIEEIEYSYDTSYYYIFVSQLLNDSVNVPIVALSDITFMTYAEVNIKVTFESGNTKEGVIPIQINLSNNEDLLNRIYDYLQMNLDEVDILANVLATRAEHGFSMENGDFSLITDYMGYTIKYFLRYDDTGVLVDDKEILSSIENGNKAIVNLSNLTTNEERIPIGVELYLSSEEDVGRLGYKILYFDTPAAVTKSNSSFNNFNELFYTIKIQVMQQVTPKPAYSIISGVRKEIFELVSTDVYALDDYILMHDINMCKKLILELGNSDFYIDSQSLTDFINLIAWAKGSEIKTPVSSVSYIDDSVSWITSDGSETFSDGEIAVILKYCEKYPAFEAEFRKYVFVEDNLLSDSDITSLESVFLDSNYAKIIAWAKSNTAVAANTLVENSVIPSSNENYYQYYSSNVSDGTSSISSLEEEVILAYVWSMGYMDYYPVWQTIITKNDNLLETMKLTYQFTYSTSNGTTTSTDPIFNQLWAWAVHIGSKGTGGQQTQGTSLISYLKSGLGLSALSNDSMMSFLGSIGLDSYSETKNEWFSPTFGSAVGSFATTEQQVIAAYIASNGYDTTYNVDYFADNLVKVGIFTNSYNLSDTVRNAMIASINTYRTIHDGYDAVSILSDLNTILGWAQNNNGQIVYFEDVYGANSYLFQTGGLFEGMNTKISDGSSTISYTEYTVIYHYLNTSARYNNTAYQSYFESSLSTLIKTVDMTISGSFDSQGVAEKALIYTFVENLDEFTLIFDWARGVGQINSSIKIGDIISNIDPSVFNNVSDGLYTISSQEYKAILKFFEGDDDVIAELSNVLNLSNYDRTLDEHDDLEINKCEYCLIIEYLERILSYNILGEEEDSFFYLPVDKLDFSTENPLLILSYFVNLREFSAIGNSANDLFANDSGDKTLNIVARYLSETIEKLEFKYTNISNILEVERLINLKYLDIRGNPKVNEMTELLKINSGILQYLNITGTGIEFYYNQPIFARLYFAYKNNKNLLPTYLYEFNGYEFIYEPDIDEIDIDALTLCFLLKEINTISSKYLQLPTNIITDDAERITLSWNVESGKIRIIPSGANGYRIERTDTNEEGEGIISVTVNYNGGTYTRYFTVKLPVI